MYRLRELERCDIATINRWRNDPDLIACLGAPYRYINYDVDDQWYNQYLNSRSNTVRCSIIDHNDQIIGLISLTGIDNINRCATLHIMIGNAQCRSKGAGTFAVRTMLDHAFNNLNLHRVELSALESNATALHLYEKVGFIREGVKRQCVYKNGAYENMIIMGLLRDNYIGCNNF